MWKEGRLDLTNPDTFREFFRRLYSTVETDPGVLQAEREFRFSDSAQLFELIEIWERRLRRLVEGPVRPSLLIPMSGQLRP